MTANQKSILLIEDNHADVEVVTRFLDLAGDKEYRLAIGKTLAEGKQLIESTSFDLILLDQNLPDSLDGQTLSQCMSFSQHIPIIVLTGFGDQEEGARKVRQGAQDYLVKGSFDAPLLMRVIRYTIERQAMQKEMALMKLTEQKALELKSLEAIAMQPGSGGNSATPASIQSAAPTYYSDLILRYEGFLDAALEQRIYKSDRALISAGIRDFTMELARYSAGPREIVEIHSTALERRLKNQNELKSQAYLEEARLLLLETMGSLVQTYRGKFTIRESISTPSR
ncbi:MAG: response regulator [Proteobacteria bacterium]|nr:MAG: response regulator [Pseudomonadota bacterium]